METAINTKIEGFRALCVSVEDAHHVLETALIVQEMPKLKDLENELKQFHIHIENMAIGKIIQGEKFLRNF